MRMRSGVRMRIYVLIDSYSCANTKSEISSKSDDKVPRYDRRTYSPCLPMLTARAAVFPKYLKKYQRYGNGGHIEKDTFAGA